MKYLLANPFFESVKEAIPPLEAKTEYFASADGDSDDHGAASRWMRNLSALNVNVLRKVCIGIYSYVEDSSLKESAGQIVDLLTETHSIGSRTSNSFLVRCEFLSWLHDVNRAAFSEARSPHDVIRKMQVLPALIPEISATFKGWRFSVPLNDGIWPVGGDWAVAPIDAMAQLCIDQKGASTLIFDGTEVELNAPTQLAGNRAIFKRRYLNDRATETTVPRYPFHRVWEHKFNENRDVDESAIFESVSESFELLNKAWPEARGLQPYVQRIIAYVPVNGSLHNSASTEEFPFVQYSNVVLGSEMENLFSYIHEAMHSKLGVLMSAHELHEHGDVRAFRHPWMDSLRPANGVFLGAHAFLTILELASRALNRIPEARCSANDEFKRRLPEVSAALKEISTMKLTPIGNEFLEVSAARFERISRST